MCAIAHVWRGQRSFQELRFPLLLCGMHGMQIIRLDGEYLYLQSHLASPTSKLLVQMETNISMDNN